MPEQACPAVVVTGMRRAGTSLLSSALAAMGYEFGPSDLVIQAPPDQPNEFFERRDIRELNERFLGALGWSLEAPQPDLGERTPLLPELVSDGRRLVASLRAVTAPALNDPRISVLLPWWREIVGDSFVTVVAIQGARDAAWNSAIREGIPPDTAFAIWAATYRSIAAALQGQRVIVVRTTELAEDPRRWLPVLIDALVATTGIADVQTDAVIDAVLEFPDRPVRCPGSSELECPPGITDLDSHWNPGEQIWFADRLAIPLTHPERWEFALLERQRRLVEQRQSWRLMAAELSETRRQRDTLRLELEHLTRSFETQRSMLDTLSARVDRLTGRSTKLLEGISARPAMRTLSTPAASAGGEPIDHDRGVRSLSPRLVRLILRFTPPRLSALLVRNPLFDRDWYVAHNDDVAARRVNPEAHFRLHGAREGRNPSATFNTRWYLERYPDVAASGMNPLDHYWLHGRAERRIPTDRAQQKPS